MRVQSEDKKRQRAYSIWEAEGRPDGRALAHWLQAEAELSARLKPRKKKSLARAEPREAKAKAVKKKKPPSTRSKSTKRS